LRIRPFNLAGLFELMADTVPDRLALVAGTTRFTYAELDTRANHLAHHLIEAGVAPGAHVGILARNRAAQVEAMIGCYPCRTAPVGSLSATTRTRQKRRPPLQRKQTASGGRCPATWPPIALDGVITVHGRGSASINSGGEKIVPEEVEAPVKAYSDV